MAEAISEEKTGRSMLCSGEPAKGVEMKRFLALFLALSISLQSFTAVGESTRLVGDSSVQNEQSPEEGLSSDGDQASMEDEAETIEEQTISEETEASSEAGEVTSSQEELSSQTSKAGVEEELTAQESSKDEGKAKPEVGEQETEQLPTLSYSTIERNEKKHFQYKNEEITVNAELEYPESLPKGVMFLVRPILEEERKEQYQAYKEALLEAKRGEQKDALAIDALSKDEGSKEPSDTDAFFMMRNLRILPLLIYLREAFPIRQRKMRIIALLLRIVLYYMTCAFMMWAFSLWKKRPANGKRFSRRREV